VLAALLLPPGSLPAASSDEAITRRLGSRDCLMVTTREGTQVLEHNPDRALIPASILKLFTAWYGLSTFGDDFRFTTEVYLSGKNLLVRGTGDPALTSSEVDRLAREVSALLRARGITELETLYLDGTAFAVGTIPGTSGSDNPYDVLNGALVVNYNTIFVRRLADGTIVSAEEETPITPFAVTQAKRYLLKSQDRINAARTPVEVLALAGDLLAVFFERHGLRIGRQVQGSWPQALGKPLYLHRASKPLSELVRELLRYSNNFTANQLLLAAGGLRTPPPVVLSKAVRSFQDFLEARGYGEVRVVEGSGIAGENRLSCRAMTRLLRTDWYPHRDLLHKSWKSGTLDAAMSYAGYLGDHAFCLILNDRSKHRNLYAAREELLSALRHRFPSSGR